MSILHDSQSASSVSDFCYLFFILLNLLFILFLVFYYMFYNMSMAFLLSSQIPARTFGILIFGNLQCICRSMNNSVAAVCGSADSINVQTLFLFHLFNYNWRSFKKIFFCVTV